MLESLVLTLQMIKKSPQLNYIIQMVRSLNTLHARRGRVD